MRPLAFLLLLSACATGPRYIPDRADAACKKAMRAPVYLDHLRARVCGCEYLSTDPDGKDNVKIQVCPGNGGGTT